MTLEIEYEDKRASNLCPVTEKVYFNENKKDKPAVIMAVGVGRIEAKNFKKITTEHSTFYVGEAIVHGKNAKLILHL